MGLLTKPEVPCTFSPSGVRAPQPTVNDVRFAEAPLWELLEVDPATLTLDEQKALVLKVNELRKSPQTLQAKMKKDRETLDLEFGSLPADVLQAKFAKTPGVRKPRSTNTQVIKSAAKLQDQYAI